MIEICPLRQSLLDCQGHALVTGGPGSGKTTIALWKAIKRIQNGLQPGQSVLFLSFSRAAVARIVEASKTESSKEQRAALDIQTFHSFFWELLCSHSYLLGTPKKIRILLPHDERALSSGAKEGDLFWAEWKKERERLWREEGRIAFDFFARAAVELLEGSSILRNIVAQRFPMLIVDEAQDTNPDAWRCMELLSPHAQIICLADLDQQIFDHLEGIGPERIEAIKQALDPMEINLGGQNHRSGATEIAVFGRDILAGNYRGAPYKGISRLGYSLKGLDHPKLLRQALGIIFKAIKNVTGEFPESVAILCISGASAVRISGHLSEGEKPIPHKLLFDETEALLASRFAAFLLESANEGDFSQTLAQALELLADIKRASGAQEGKQIQKWADRVRDGDEPKAGLVQVTGELIREVGASPFLGDPVQDWSRLKKVLRASKEPKFAKIAYHLDYLVAFNRGKRINGNLTEIWQRDGRYTGARAAVEAGLAQDQLLGGIDDPSGIQVMTIHKAKGKQFDGVVLVRSMRHEGQKMQSDFVWKGDTAPYTRSRKILMVGITRAKLHTLILDPVFPECPLLHGHKL